jgi:HTH-type transcriptional regulator / antitoxin HigA
MVALKYKVIKSRKQYFEYCRVLNELVSKKLKSQRLKDEVELLTVLIEKWDKDHNKFENADPISLLKFLLQQHNMTAQDLVKILGVSKGLVSDILNYKKGLSKETVRKLAAHFKIDQAAFNRQYSVNKAQQNKSLKWLAKQAQELNLGY